MEKTPKQVCIETFVELGFSGDDCHFDKGDCHVWITDDRIRLSFNLPGVDKEYFGPPLPSKGELVRFIEVDSGLSGTEEYF